MNVAVYPADDGGCGSYRIIWPAETLRVQGADVRISRPGDPDQIRAVFIDDPAPRVCDVVAPDADVVVLQRPLKRELADAIPHLQARGVRVVVEIDDDFSCVHPRNVSWRHVHPRESPDRNFQHLQRACRQADHVVCTTPALAARYGRHGRVSVVPNHVPGCYLDVQVEPHDGLYVGWSGSIDTHPDDLQETGGVMQQALDSAGATMAVVGTGVGVKRALRLREAPVACGWVPIDEYPVAMANFDVGIVPLQPSKFNEAKSALKMMEMAAVGVPVIASPTADNRRMHRAGVGDMAGRPREWGVKLRALLASPDARAASAERGRDAMRRFTIEGNADRWWDAWTAPLRAKVAA